MIIKNKAKNCFCIDDLKKGDMFQHEGSIFIKTDLNVGGGIVCVELETGESLLFYDYNIKVEIVTGTLTLD